MKVIIVTFDRLPLRMLGCYGNHWIETPNFDQLAARSVVFDNHFAECVDNSFSEHAWMDGCFHFPRQPQQLESLDRLPQLLRVAGIGSTLIAEQSDGSQQYSELGFDKFVEVVGSEGLDIEHSVTPIAELVRHGIEWICENAAACEESQLLWMKSRGVPNPWIPPDFFASLYLDELETDAEDEDNEAESEETEDEAEDSNAVANHLELFTQLCGETKDTSSLSEDEWAISRFVYAGYVTMLDLWLGRLVECIREKLADQPVMLVVTAASGQVLGERVDETSRPSNLAEQVVHTPLIVWHSETESLGSRRSDFVQATDLLPTIVDAIGGDSSALGRDGVSLLSAIKSCEKVPRDYLCMGDTAGNTAIRTREFYFIQNEDKFTESMFLKPDDQWDVYEIAKQNAADAESLATTLDQFVANAKTSVPLIRSELAKIDE